MSGPRYFNLAQRTFAFSGVMAARAEAQAEEGDQRRQTSTRTHATPAREPEQAQSVAALAARFPDEIELVRVAADG